jgi:glycosyltransferase involved in cell wall biosynthesis
LITLVPKLAIVIPCYNETEVIDETISRLDVLLKKMIGSSLVATDSYVLLVDDGSKDDTWEKMCQFHQSLGFVKAIKLAKNAGHQNALLAGLMYAKEHCDCAVSIDADLQDDIEKIPEFVEKFISGAHIVYGVRSKREKDTWFKRVTAQGFYRLMNRMGVHIVYDHADYRLMSKVALEELSKFKEVHLFLRGIVPLIGYKQDVVHYERHERFAGSSKYPLKKMLAFAFNGISSFSIRPIRLVSSIGIVISLISLCAIAYSIISWTLGRTVTGWTSLILSIWFLGGVQILSLGLVGEYIGKIYQEVKQRPRFIVEHTLV